MTPHVLKFGVKLDGKCIGYSMTQLCSSSRLGCEMVFHGCGRTDPLTGMIAYRAFKFGALTPAACAATVEHPDQIQAGRIEVTCEAVVKTGQGTGKHRDAGWAADAASKKLPEGAYMCTRACADALFQSTRKQRAVAARVCAQHKARACGMESVSDGRSGSMHPPTGCARLWGALLFFKAPYMPVVCPVPQQDLA